MTESGAVHPLLVLQQEIVIRQLMATNDDGDSMCASIILPGRCFSEGVKSGDGFLFPDQVVL